MNAEQIVTGMKKVKPFTLKFTGKGRLKSDSISRAVKFFEVSVKDCVMTITGKTGEFVIDGVVGGDFAGRIEAMSFELFAYLDGNDVTLMADDDTLTGWAGRCKFTFLALDPKKAIKGLMYEKPHMKEVTFDGITYVAKFTQGYRNFEIVAL